MNAVEFYGEIVSNNFDTSPDNFAYEQARLISLFNKSNVNQFRDDLTEVIWYPDINDIAYIIECIRVNAEAGEY